MDALTNCNCPAEGRAITCDDVSVVLSCASCGGWAVVITDSIDGCIDALTKIKADCYRALGDIAPPGRAVIASCPDCAGAGCGHCHGTGMTLRKACPRCGDIGFDYLHGHDQDQGMICRIACGLKWSADDPRWLAQHIPSVRNAGSAVRRHCVLDEAPP
jgi:hypothetical protein